MVLGCFWAVLNCFHENYPWNQPSPYHFRLIDSGQVASSARLVAESRRSWASEWNPTSFGWGRCMFYGYPSEDLRSIYLWKHSLDEVFNALNLQLYLWNCLKRFCCNFFRGSFVHCIVLTCTDKLEPAPGRKDFRRSGAQWCEEEWERMFCKKTIHES